VNNPDFLQCDQAATICTIHQFRKRGFKRFNLAFLIHDLDDHGEVGRKVQNLGCANSRAGAVSQHAFEHSRTGQARIPRFLDDGFEQGQVADLVAFADENS